MKQLLIFSLAVMTGASSFSGDMRMWNLANGKTIEAELVSVVGEKVALKGIRGKLIKVPRTAISDDDRVYIELSQPPALDFSFSKKTAPFTYAPLTPWFEQEQPPPRSQFYTFSTQIKQTSSNPYHHELIAEVFVIAAEEDGDKHVLLDYRREGFRLNDENKRIANIAGAEDLMLTSYIAPGGMWRGEKFSGYLIVVTDTRGEIIAHKATREWWYEKLENLRSVPVGKTFDAEGNRCWPTRPRIPDY